MMFEWLGNRFGKVKRNNKQVSGHLQQKDTEKSSIFQDDLLQQASSSVLHTLLKTAIIDAEQMVISIKAKARTEAEAEAAEIVAKAKLEVQEITKRAEIAAQKQTEAILAEANKKAEAIEVEAKQKALQFLTRIGEEVGKEIGDEYKKVYNKLSNSLQELVSEGQKLEAELKEKTAKLRERKGLELKGHEAKLLRAPEVVVLPPETPDSPEPEPVPEKVEEAAQPEGEVAEEKVEEAAQLEEEVVEGDSFKGMTLDRQVIYSGEVELNISTPVELRLVSKFYSYLQTIPELRILYTRGSWDQGTIIVVVLEKPMPLIGILTETPDVKVIPEPLRKDNSLREKSGSILRGGKRDIVGIRVILEEPSS